MMIATIHQATITFGTLVLQRERNYTPYHLCTYCILRNEKVLQRIGL